MDSSIGFYFGSSSGLGHEYAASAVTPKPSSFLQLYQQATPVLAANTTTVNSTPTNAENGTYTRSPLVVLNAATPLPNNLQTPNLGAVVGRMEAIMTRLEAFERALAMHQPHRTGETL